MVTPAAQSPQGMEPDSPMDLDHLQDALGVPDAQRPWLRELGEQADRSNSSAVLLPARSQAQAALAPFALRAEDERELVQMWPDGSWPEEHWWLLRQLSERVVADIGQGYWRSWPALTEVTDARVRCVTIFAFAAAVPHLRAWHGRHGVSDEVSGATLADVGRHVAKNRDMFGRIGLEVATWIALHFRGGLYQLGRLQYEPAQLGFQASITWYESHEQAGLPAWLRQGAPVLRLHIPEMGPLDAVEVEYSLTQARAFFRHHFGGDYPVASCSSWLLDPQLTRYLSPSANIVAFQRRFRLVPRDSDGDADVFRFVFRHFEVDTQAVTVHSRLERSIVEHLRAGGSWRVRTGWLRL